MLNSISVNFAKAFGNGNGNGVNLAKAFGNGNGVNLAKAFGNGNGKTLNFNPKTQKRGQ